MNSYCSWMIREQFMNSSFPNVHNRFLTNSWSANETILEESLKRGFMNWLVVFMNFCHINYSWNKNISISRTVHELNLSWMVHEFFVTRICCLICTSCSGHELFMMTSWWTFHEQRFMISWTFHEFEFMPLRNCSTREVHMRYMQYRSSPKSQHTFSTAPAVL